MAVLWNPGGQILILKRNMTIGYVKESDHMEKDPPEHSKIQEKQLKHNPLKHYLYSRGSYGMSHDKLPPMPDKSAFMFHHNFYPKPKIDLEDTDITQETRQKLLNLQ